MSVERSQRRISPRIGVLGVLFISLCLVVTVVLIWLLREEARSSDSDAQNQIVYGLTLYPSGFDPHQYVSAELGIPFFSVYDTLVYRHPQTMDFVPGLAERWEMSPDGLSWTFYLRHDVQFHDGTPFDAQAVGINFERIMNAEVGSAKARGLLGGSAYLGYDILDDYTIRINLSEPFAPLLDGLSQVYLGIASPKALSDYTKNTYQFHQVGTGPYRVVEVVPREKIVLELNPDYAWGPVFYASTTEEWRAKALERIEFRFYTDPATRSLALESGEVQIIGELLPIDAELLAGNTALRIFQIPIPGTPQQFFFNTQHAPVDDIKVRQALLYGTNRTHIADTVFQGQSPIAYGPLTANTPFYDPDVQTDSNLAYPHSVEYARSLLAEAGYKADRDGMLERDGEPLKVTMVFAPWNQMADVAQLIQSQWRDIGVDLDLIQVPDYPTLLEYANNGNYDLIAIYDFGVEASILNQFYLSDGSRNWTGYSDPELDNWLLEGVREPDSEKRALIYGSIQRRIMEQALILPIRDYVNLNGTSAQLDGVIFNSQGWWPLLRNMQWTP